MAAISKVLWLCIISTFLLLGKGLAKGENKVISEGVVTITSNNWRDLLTGEWMVEFYAPWCPYCTQFTPVWAEFATWVNEFDVRVGQVDVTEESVLGGQFMVEQLPTIFHIKDGEVRMYSGERIIEHLQNYIEHNAWIKDSPIPWYKSPTSLHMYGMGWLFKMAQEAQKLEQYLRDEYDLPTWGIFGLVATATVVVGLLLGVIFVLMCELASRLCGRRTPPQKKPRPQSTQETHPQPAAREERPLEPSTISSGSSTGNQGKRDKGVRKRNTAKED